jgi:thiosulfate reductase cytochrome b subunit
MTQAHPGSERSAPVPGREVIYRHTLVVRLTHWINVMCLALLLMSGLRLFNYHPALYWGNYGYRGVAPVFAIGSVIDPAGGAPVGLTLIAGSTFVTTGVLGVSHDPERGMARRAFPAWLTLPGEPGLALARDLAPARDQLRPRHILADIWDHARLRRPRGEAARRYNLLQKLAYLIVIFLLLPIMVLSGLTMSPAVTAAAPFLFDLFGGRQSARTIHFIVANLLVLFVLVHVLEMLIAGAFNGMRSMITGRYVVRLEHASPIKHDPEKWIPVFGKDHAPPIKQEGA